MPPAARAIARAAASRVARERDVEVGRRAPEQAVADRAADEPGRLAGERRAGGLERVRHGPWTRGTRAEIPQVTS